MPVIEKDDGLHLLFQLRSDNLKRQPGEISFPGGKMEAGETPLECALRETEEEIGVPAESIKLISELNYINSYSNFTMHAFLGSIDESLVDNTKINRSEVKELFTVPLDFFIDTTPYIYEYELLPEIGSDFPYKKYDIEENYDWRKGKSCVPIYQYNDRVIWGLTARLILDFVEVIGDGS